MYVYAISEDLIGATNNLIDVDIRKIGRSAVGFDDMPLDEVDSFSDIAKEKYWDQYRKADREAQEKGVIDRNFHYWRKFNALHGWMHDLYLMRGGKGDFNCKTVRLFMSDINDLKQICITKSLTPVSGFFFGAQEIYDEDWASLEKFLANAVVALDSGKALYYDSWW